MAVSYRLVSLWLFLAGRFSRQLFITGWFRRWLLEVSLADGCFLKIHSADGHFWVLCRWVFLTGLFRWAFLTGLFSRQLFLTGWFSRHSFSVVVSEWSIDFILKWVMISWTWCEKYRTVNHYALVVIYHAQVDCMHRLLCPWWNHYAKKCELYKTVISMGTCVQGEGRVYQQLASSYVFVPKPISFCILKKRAN